MAFDYVWSSKLMLYAAWYELRLEYEFDTSQKRNAISTEEHRLFRSALDHARDHAEWLKSAELAGCWRIDYVRADGYRVTIANTS